MELGSLVKSTLKLIDLWGPTREGDDNSIELPTAYHCCVFRCLMSLAGLEVFF